MGDSAKAVLIGDADVGKTCIFKRLEDDTFDNRERNSVSGSLLQIRLRDGGGCPAELRLWDTAGSERYRSIVPMYFRCARIIVCVFDLTSAQSFAHVTEWVELARNRARPNVQFLLVGNKSDRDSERQVDFTSGQRLSEQIGAKAYIETSALNGTGIDLFRNQLATMVSTAPPDAHVESVAPQRTNGGRRPRLCAKGCRP
jgi:small GTP-binding protein